jgi:multiple sugar transport system permease protein
VVVSVPVPLGRLFLDGLTGYALAASDFPLLMGASILITIPVVIVFSTFQRHVVHGVAGDGVKG